MLIKRLTYVNREKEYNYKATRWVIPCYIFFFADEAIYNFLVSFIYCRGFSFLNDDPVCLCKVIKAFLSGLKKLCII